MGTIINVAAVIVGSLIGLLINRKLPQKIVTIIFQVMGLFTLVLGISMSLKTEHYIIVIASLVLGAVIGEWIGLEKYMNQWSEKLKSRLKFGNDKFTDGLVTAFLLYCMGAMTILGAVEEGLEGTYDILLMKSLMDGVSSVALASALGVGVIFSVIPMLVYQGGLTLFSAYVEEHFTEVIISDLSATGGILLIGLGINILEIKHLKILNMVPALVIVVILSYLIY
ncbi:MAG: DUF554 domain-containing protein [Bacteroidales bacterium]|jgi:uncharacterized membrane protein YqgA involved in biofilm formation|nr:DUF554 domain-containing protein [Bacteroidales bacterium]